MLIYNKTGKLVACTNDSVLKPLGHESVEDFFSVHDDLSELFIQRVGYIAAYDNLPWVAFLFNDILPQNKVLVTIDSKECEFLVKSQTLFSKDMDSIGVTFEAASTQSDALASTPPIDEPVQEDAIEPNQPQALDEDEELMQLLNITQEDSTQEESEPIKEPKKETSALDDLEEFELDFDETPPNEQTPKEEKQEPLGKDDDLYDLDLDFSNDEPAKEEPIQEDLENKENDDLEQFELDLKEYASEEKPNSVVQEEPKADAEFEQYIDSKEYESSKEVDLENLSNELGLEFEESANFIHDFTTMIKAKKELLSGESAAIEASSLKNIAENFRLFNIVKTLETIENGEPNSALLFSQIEKLQKELSPYTKQTQSSGSSSVAWDGAEKQTVEFDPNVAAESLGLPTELISEFVNDFVEQAKESKEIFDSAYAQKDITTIKETAHKLKGAAANLRIEPIATKLEELQHNDDLDAVPQMLTEFWGMYHGLREVV